MDARPHRFVLLETACALVVSLSLLSSTPATARGLIFPDYELGARPTGSRNDCSNAPMACDQEMRFDDLGTYDFEIYAGADLPGSVDGLKFGFFYPEDWVVLDYELCNSTVVAGDPLEPGLGLEIEASDGCWEEGMTLYRVTMECASPGALFMTGPMYSRLEFRWCDSGDWQIGESYAGEAVVNIGDFCGRLDYYACQVCPTYAACRFRIDPVDVVLPPGGVESVEVSLSGNAEYPSCGNYPECDGDQMYPCMSDLYEESDWMEPTLVSSDENSRVYDLAIDATGLAPGEYHDRLYCRRYCNICQYACLEVTLRVAEPAGVSESSSSLPRLISVHPNPVRQELRLRIGMDDPAPVLVEVLDVTGSQIAVVHVGHLSSGIHQFEWDTVGGDGGLVPSGIYFVSERVSGQSERFLVIR